MEEELTAFFSSPSLLRRIWRFASEFWPSDQYNPYSLELHEAMTLLEAENHADAGEVIVKSMPNLLLSPIAHQLLSQIAERFNDQQTTSSEHTLALLCLSGVLATGDGSRKKPYAVLRISDEYDVVRHFGKQSISESVGEDADRLWAQINCDEGTDLWFDITDAVLRRHLMVNTPYDVVLSEVGPNRLKVMSLVREIWGLSPTAAKSLLESPQPLLAKVLFLNRNHLQSRFAQIGASVKFENPNVSVGKSANINSGVLLTHWLMSSAIYRSPGEKITQSQPPGIPDE